MRILTVIICLCAAFVAASAQNAREILATANGREYAATSLSSETAQNWTNLTKMIEARRAALLSETVAEFLFEAEAKAKNISVEKLLDAVRAKVAAPTAAQIQAVYDANRAALGTRTLDEVKPQIVAFLRREPEEKALENYAARLRTKYKATLGKDINAADLKPTDTVAVIVGKPLTAQDFEKIHRVELYDLRMNVFDAVRGELEQLIFADLVDAEAKAQNISSSDLMAREITDKMRDYSDEERFDLQEKLRDKLFAKYKTNLKLKEPAPLVQQISVDDDPARGPAAAPVTVVMFSDFQCPACSATHPILQKVLAAYADKIRFVVRDFPLTSIHANAFLAAQAANAARAQGKFFEYTEILYRNQNALDAASLKKYAADLGLNVKQFELDLQSGKFAAEVRHDMADGALYGIRSTPTIFINGVKIRENSPTAFKNAIERALKK